MEVEVFKSLVIGEADLKIKTIKIPKLKGVDIENIVFSLGNNSIIVEDKDIFVVVGYTEDGSIRVSIEDYLELKKCGKIINDFIKIGYLKK